MNNYYAKLNLPDVATLFKDLNQLWLDSEDPCKIFDKDVLSDVAFDFFKTINVTPRCVARFINPRLKNYASIESRYIHNDITLDENNSWKPIYCGINFELGNTTTANFQWFDMGEHNKVWPEAIPTNDLLKILNGVHYGQRRQIGQLPGVTCIANTIITGPTLVRTDVPHAVTYQSLEEQRNGISIRFEETWNSWEECLEVFKPIIDK